MSKSRVSCDAQWPLQDIPYRLTPRPAGLEAEAEIRRMELLPVQPLIPGWLGHADEAVVLAALERFGEEYLRPGSPLMREGAGRMMGAVLEAEYGRAEAEGILWSPVIDRMAETIARFPRLRKEMEAVLIQPLFEWVRAQKDPSRYRTLLLDARSYLLQSRLATRAGEIEEAVLERALAGDRPLFDRLSESAALRPEQARRMLDRAIDLIENSTAEELRSQGHGDSPGNAAARLILGFGASRAQTERLLACLDAGKKVEHALQHALLRSTALLTSADLDRYWSYFINTDAPLLAAHPALTTALAHRLLMLNRSAPVLQAIARRVEMLDDAKLRAILFRQTSLKTQDAIFSYLRDPAAMKTFLPRYLKVRPLEALRAIVDGHVPPERLSHLAPDDLLGVLADPSQEVRLLALRATAMLQATRAPATAIEQAEPALAPLPRSMPQSVRTKTQGGLP
jgi:hypothetical protein